MSGSQQLLLSLVDGLLKVKDFVNTLLQVEPGKPGAEVSKGKNYKPKKEFAYRMCTG